MVSFRFSKTRGYFGDVPLGPHPRKLCFAFGPKTTGWQQPTLANDQSFHNSSTTHSLTPSHFSAGKYRSKYSCQGGPFFFESFDSRLGSLRSQGGKRSGVINCHSGRFSIATSSRYFQSNEVFCFDLCKPQV